MRKLIFLAAAMAAMILSSCAKTEPVIGQQDENAISFGAYQTQQTRGTITDISVLRSEGYDFGVLAYYTGQDDWTAIEATAKGVPDFMYNELLEWSGAEWVYSPTKYWPNTLNDKVTFFAYAPYAGEETEGSVANRGVVVSPNELEGYPYVDFTIDEQAVEMEDLVYADNLINRVKSTDKQLFIFEHALTRLLLTAKLDKDLAAMYENNKGKTHVFITSAYVVGTNHLERYPDPQDPSNGNSASRFFQSARLQFGVDNDVPEVEGTGTTWLLNEGDPTLVQQADAYSMATIMPLVDQSAHVGNTEYTPLGVEVNPNMSETPLFKNHLAGATEKPEYLFLIPPYGFGGIKAETDVILQIGYDIVTNDDKLMNGNEEGKSGYSITHTDARISLPIGTLVQAVAYKFVLTIGLEDVKIDAQVTDWGTEQNYYAPSTEVTVDITDGGHLAALANGMKTLNAAKAVNPDCNYFVVRTTGEMINGVDLNNAAVMNIFNLNYTNFVSGDIIEFIFTNAEGNALPFDLNNGAVPAWEQITTAQVAIAPLTMNTIWKAGVTIPVQAETTSVCIRFK